MEWFARKTPNKAHWVHEACEPCITLVYYNTMVTWSKWCIETLKVLSLVFSCTSILKHRRNPSNIPDVLKRLHIQMLSVLRCYWPLSRFFPQPCCLSFSLSHIHIHLHLIPSSISPAVLSLPPPHHRAALCFPAWPCSTECRSFHSCLSGGVRMEAPGW